MLQSGVHFVGALDELILLLRRSSCNLNAGCFCVILISTRCGLSLRRMMLVVSRRLETVLDGHHLPSACR